MNLKNVFNQDFDSITGNIDRELLGIHFDSRKIRNDYLFVAVKGTKTDGHVYIDQAVANGATAVICETLPAAIQSDVTYIQVKDSADALGHAASAWFDHPSRKMVLVGVTGTNGKTTVASLLYQLFETSGYKAGLFSTVCNYVHKKMFPATHTTPDPIELNSLLAQMVDEGCKYVFMEVSSHAIVQKRISGLHFDGGIFTNLTHDHLDYHGTFEAYRDAKKSFFDTLPAEAFALTNPDDKNGTFMLQNTKAKKHTYSLKALADFKGRINSMDSSSTVMEINGLSVTTGFIGMFNACNVLAVYSAAVLLGEQPVKVLCRISTLRPVAGRFETFQSPGKYTVIVDYAHTPDALTNVLTTIRELVADRGKVITVVGCGGDRDKSKRPIMGKEAYRLSDMVILTSDNPRSEYPEDIIRDMLGGLTETEKEDVDRIPNRIEAIDVACRRAMPCDIILIAGKGHEEYQEIDGVKHPYSDQEIVREIFDYYYKKRSTRGEDICGWDSKMKGK